MTTGMAGALIEPLTAAMDGATCAQRASASVKPIDPVTYSTTRRSGKGVHLWLGIPPKGSYLPRLQQWISCTSGFIRKTPSLTLER